ncbi:hypothetical protein ACFQV2_20910 [Actinokineospora soli]|uniref:Uncharacterized protein n=1 Tax=Actinokineospora soli TaxID=1048753 RepID=A0ABW2TQD2_9PSEU
MRKDSRTANAAIPDDVTHSPERSGFSPNTDASCASTRSTAWWEYRS